MSDRRSTSPAAISATRTGRDCRAAAMSSATATGQESTSPPFAAPGSSRKVTRRRTGSPPATALPAENAADHRCAGPAPAAAPAPNRTTRSPWNWSLPVIRFTHKFQSMTVIAQQEMAEPGLARYRRAPGPARSREAARPTGLAAREESGMPALPGREASGLARYREALRTPGALSFAVPGVIGRLPMGMLSLAQVML